MAPYLLVVESDPELQRQIAAALSEANYQLSTEREGEWARRSLLIRVPDALVINTRLSDGTGYEVAEALRKDPDAAQVPIVFLAASDRGVSHTAEARRRFAPAEVVPGPLDASSLLARLLQILPPPVSPPRGRIDSPAAMAPPDDEQAQEGASVERQASTLQAPEAEAPALQGSLAQHSFAHVLRQLFVERRSGALLVVREQTKKIVYVEDGYPVAVRSNALQECLGQILLARRRISAEVLKRSLARMKKEKRQQGEILVEMGALSPHGLSEALLHQMEAKLLELFSWTTGSFVFKAGWRVEREAVALDRPTGALILEGVRLRYDEARKERVLALAAGKFIAPTSDPWLRLQDLTPDAADRGFMSRVDGSATLEEILNRPPVPQERARTLMVAMLEAGMVESLDQPRPAASPMPADPPSPAAPLLRRSRSELAAQVQTMRAQTHFEVLGLDPQAPVEAVEAAYLEMARVFHPDNFRGRSAAARDLVSQIFARLTEARRTLTDPSLRKSYLARLERARSHGGNPDAAVVAEQVYYTGVGHLHERRYAEAESAFRQATTLVPGQASYHGALGWAIYRRAPTDRQAVAAATAELEHAVGLAPDDPWMRVSLGRLLAETSRVDEAVALLRSALRLDPMAHDIEEEIRRLTGA